MEMEKNLRKKRGEFFYSIRSTYICGVAYVDESTVSKTIGIMETYRSFYHLVNLNEPIGTSTSVIFSTRVNCKTKKYIHDYIQFFSDQFGKGTSGTHKYWEGGYPNAPWKHDTRIEKISKHACKIKPSYVSDHKKMFKK